MDCEIGIRMVSDIAHPRVNRSGASERLRVAQNASRRHEERLAVLLRLACGSWNRRRQESHKCRKIHDVRRHLACRSNDRIVYVDGVLGRGIEHASRNGGALVGKTSFETPISTL